MGHVSYKILMFAGLERSIRMNTRFPLFVLVVSASALSQATILTASLTADDEYEAYLSTDPNVTGTLFLQNSGTWHSVETGNVTLTAGVTNYLHVSARNWSGPSMFIGSLTLSDAEFEFAATGGQTSDTGDANWQLSLTGFNTDLGTPFVIGPNGTSPWGNVASGIRPEADFIWNGVTTDAATRYFTVAITPVPEPATMTLLALGAVAALKRKKKA